MSEIEEVLEDEEPQICVPKLHDCKNGRWYEFEEKWKPSVTTFLNVISKGIGFNIWLGNSVSYELAMEYADERADLGSRIHTDIVHLVSGLPVELIKREEEEIKRLYEFIQFWHQKKPVPLHIEIPLWHPDIPFAGTADMIAEIDGEIWLLDWKTGKIYDSHTYQLSAYKYLAEKVLQITIDKMAVVRLSEYRGDEIPTIEDKAKYQFKELEPIDYRIIENIYELWVMKNSSPKPKLIKKYPSTVILVEPVEDEDDNDKQETINI